jgi:hypothetical protein
LVIRKKRRNLPISEEIFFPILPIVQILLGEMGCGEVSIVGDVHEIRQQKEGKNQEAGAPWSKIS